MVDDTHATKRKAWLTRKLALGGTDVDVKFAGLEPRGEGDTNRHGMPRLPVGQHEVKKWPVLDLGHTPELSRDDWSVAIDGLVEEPLSLDFEGLLELPRTEDVSDFHCVTSWSRFDNHWVGVRFADLMERVVPKEGAAFVVVTGYDAEPGSGVPYTTSLPLARALDPDVLLVHTWEGQPLARKHGGPVRMITPRLYAWKGTKWVRRIELCAEDRLGFWEQRGYSNTAEPWFDDRFSRRR